MFLNFALKGAPGMAERIIVQARESFACTLKDGTPFPVVAGQLFWSDDQLVKDCSHLFSELTVRSTGPSRRELKGEPKSEPKDDSKTDSKSDSKRDADPDKDSETADATPGTRRAPSSRTRKAD